MPNYRWVSTDPRIFCAKGLWGGKPIERVRVNKLWRWLFAHMNLGVYMIYIYSCFFNMQIVIIDHLVPSATGDAISYLQNVDLSILHMFYNKRNTKTDLGQALNLAYFSYLMYIAWSWEIRRFVPVMNFSFKGGILTRPAECISFWAAALITTHLKMIQLLWTLILLWNFNVILLRQIFINIDGAIHVELF